jgi:hypothetical protein
VSDQDDKQRRTEEAFKLDFEIMKQVTTADIATSVILLTIYRDIGVETLALVLTLLCFLCSLVLAFFAMIGIRNIIQDQANIHSLRYGKFARRLYPLTISLYLAGLIVFALSALQLISIAT